MIWLLEHSLYKPGSRSRTSHTILYVLGILVRILLIFFSFLTFKFTIILIDSYSSVGVSHANEKTKQLHGT